MVNQSIARPGASQEFPNSGGQKRITKLLPAQTAHLDQVNAVVGGDLVQCNAATNCHHGDLGLELGTVDTALDHRCEPLSGAVPRHVQHVHSKLL